MLSVSHLFSLYYVVIIIGVIVDRSMFLTWTRWNHRMNFNVNIIVSSISSTNISHYCTYRVCWTFVVFFLERNMVESTWPPPPSPPPPRQYLIFHHHHHHHWHRGTMLCGRDHIHLTTAYAVVWRDMMMSWWRRRTYCSSRTRWTSRNRWSWHTNRPRKKT